MTPMFPLEVAMLPGEELPLRIFEPRYVALVQDCLAMPDPAFGVVLIEAGREVGGGDRRSNVGALARIVDHSDLGVGRFRLRCLMGERIRVTQWLEDAPYPRADIEVWEDDGVSQSTPLRCSTSRTGSSRCTNGSPPRVVRSSAGARLCWVPRNPMW